MSVSLGMALKFERVLISPLLFRRCRSRERQARDQGMLPLHLQRP